MEDLAQMCSGEQNPYTLKTLEDYPYVYETHLHTCYGSACGKDTGANMARAAKAAGYTGIIVTDHFIGGNTRPDVKLPWAEWVEQFCKGYEEAKRVGNQIGLQVFFGWEARFNGPEFLIYGLSPEWLLHHPELKEITTVEEQYQLIHGAGGMVIYAHPFRSYACTPLSDHYAAYVDGAEGINATHSCQLSKAHVGPIFDVKAMEYVRRHHLAVTAGSDVHSTAILYGGMAMPRKLKDIQDFIQVVKGKEDYRLLTGNESIPAVNP